MQCDDRSAQMMLVLSRAHGKATLLWQTHNEQMSAQAKRNGRAQDRAELFADDQNEWLNTGLEIEQNQWRWMEILCQVLSSEGCDDRRRWTMILRCCRGNPTKWTMNGLTRAHQNRVATAGWRRGISKKRGVSISWGRYRNRTIWWTDRTRAVLRRCDPCPLHRARWIGLRRKPTIKKTKNSWRRRWKEHWSTGTDWVDRLIVKDNVLDCRW